MRRAREWAVVVSGCAAVLGLLIWRLQAVGTDSPSRTPEPGSRAVEHERFASGHERTASAPEDYGLRSEAEPPIPADRSPGAMTEREIIDGEASVRKKLLALPMLPEDKQLITAWRLGEELGKSRDRLDEVLRLLRAEEDPAVLYWLGEVIRGGRGALAKLTDAEWVGLVATLLYGQPAERRRAVAGIHSEYMRSPPSEVRDALRQCIRTESDPSVLAVAARGLLCLQTSWEGMADDLAGAVRRMPEGKLRREMTYVYKRYVDVGVLHARFFEARSDGERNDWAYAISVAWSEGHLDEANDPTRLFVEVYAGVSDPGVRLRLLQSCPSDSAMVRELVATETVPRLREKLEELLQK